MPFWDILISDVSCVSMLKKSIASLSCEYVLNAPAIGQIAFKSHSDFEGMFMEGMPVTIQMGWSPTDLVDMIHGEVVTRPDGVASSELSYTLTIMDKKQVSLSKEAKNRVFKSVEKNLIVDEILSPYNIDFKIEIADTTPIPQINIPIQKNETDMEYLLKISHKWNCLCWIFDDTIYFVDADKAHEYGNIYRTKSIEDIYSDYDLNYRYDNGTNNIAKLSWKKKDTKGGGAGTPGATGTDEAGEIKKPTDFEVEAHGKMWRFSPATLKQVKNNPNLINKYINILKNSDYYETEASLKKYFVPITHNMSTEKSSSSVASHKSAGIELSINLNVGDPFLRPPRKGILQCGTTATENSYLPSFLFPEGRYKQYYNINKVKTQLNSGMIKTSLVASR